MLRIKLARKVRSEGPPYANFYSAGIFRLLPRGPPSAGLYLYSRPSDVRGGALSRLISCSHSIFTGGTQRPTIAIAAAAISCVAAAVYGANGLLPPRFYAAYNIYLTLSLAPGALLSVQRARTRRDDDLTRRCRMPDVVSSSYPRDTSSIIFVTVKVDPLRTGNDTLASRRNVSRSRRFTACNFSHLAHFPAPESLSPH